MKATGIVRKIDDLGRIVIPMELRRVLDIDLKDPIEIFVDEDFVILKKYNPACSICGSMDELVNFNNKKVCKQCVQECIKEME